LRQRPDFDVEKKVAYVKSAQTYDGGISEEPLGESRGAASYLFGRRTGTDGAVREC
jgi:prenyltransferase beta subunit